jgi:hypothetical protein
MQIFGFTPFGIYCRVCKGDGVHVGPNELTIFLHLQSKHHGVFTRETVGIFKAVADKEVEKLSRHADLESYLLGDHADGFACRCENVFRKKEGLVRHCKVADSCQFGVHKARPELLFKTVCGRTVSQATLNRMSASSLPTAGLSNFARTAQAAALGTYEEVGTSTALFRSPAEGDEAAPIPAEIVSNGNDEPHLSGGTVKVRRKAAKRTLLFDLTAGELSLVKRLRLEEQLPTKTDEDAKKTASPDISVALSPTVAGRMM